MDNKVSYHTKLVGVTFEGRQDILAVLKGDEPLRVRREPENEYDPNAVAVDVQFGEDWSPVGYIAKDKNSDISAALDAGNEVSISIASKTGGDLDSKGKAKSFGLNVAVSYEKVSRAEQVAKAEEKAKEEPVVPDFKDMLNKALEGLGLVENKSKKQIFKSRLLGKSTEVTVSETGHISLPGYLSGSKFPEKFYPKFDKDGILDKMIEKHFKDKDDETKARIKEAILKMWDINRVASTSYGSGIHAAMENYDTNYKLGDKLKEVKEYVRKPTYYGPNKSLSKNPFLKQIVEWFHEKFGGDYIRLSEQFIWTHEEKLCGSIDRVKVIDADKRIIRIQDFKTDGDIHEKKYQIAESVFKKEMGNELLDLHWLQLSFYAYILTKYYGYIVEGLDVYWLNPNKLIKGENPWEEFSHEVINIEKGL